VKQCRVPILSKSGQITTGLAKSPAPILELGPEIELREESCNLLPTNLPIV
jgi:hypothetical protein